MKTNGIRISKIIKNNFQMLSTVYHADAGYIGFTLLVRTLSGIAASFLHVYLLGTVLYCVESGKELGFILLFLLLGTGFFAAVFALRAYYDHIFKPVHRERIVSGLQHGLFEKLQSADMANYDSTELYTTVALANEEIPTLPLDMTDNLFRGFECLAATGAVLAGTVPGNWFVFGICMVSFGVGAFLTNVQSKKIVQYDGHMKRKDKKLSLLRRLLYLPEYAKDNRLSHVHDVFLADYRAAVKEKEEIADSSGKEIARLSFLQKLFCSAFCIDFLVPFLLSIAVLLFGKLSISEFVIAINAAAQIQLKLDDLTSVMAEFLKNGRFAERIRDIDKIQCGIETAAGIRPADRMQALSMNKVTFVYPDGTPGVSGIDLSLQKGSKVAIVGRNGSGKSTLIKLLLRFYDPTSGEILQNGTDIRSFETASYRAQFGAAFQDFNLYATSIRNNICMGEGRMERERMEEERMENGQEGRQESRQEQRLIHALEKAGLSGRIKDLDAQLTKEFDEEGVLFSGGLLQRLALARVFYRDSDIVILDEPTAAMDVFFERKFYDTVFENLKEKTVLFVSHRLSSITACDKILYMEHGRILEEGTHEHLMSLQGGYYKLFHAQFE